MGSGTSSRRERLPSLGIVPFCKSLGASARRSECRDGRPPGDVSIRRALEIGFTLDELAKIFRQRASGDPPCHRVRDLAAQKLREIDEQISRLTTVRVAMREIVADWDARLQSTRDGEMAHLLDSLIEPKEDSQ
ncbi:MAG: hypothetical protein DMF58_19605 [Acidobacteria bacterium]|nr:MAG: hypothetical protein DMF58_19605 [Acidobacteriota bacterium]